MQELIDLIKEIDNNIKVDEKNQIEPFINSYYIQERLKIILANLTIYNEKISNK